MPTVSIYLSDELLGDIQKVSELKGISVSKVLAESFRDPNVSERVIVNPPVNPQKLFDRLDRIEEKLDNLGLQPAEQGLLKTRAKGQAELDKKRKGRDIKKEKIEKVKDFFNPQPKG